MPNDTPNDLFVRLARRAPTAEKTSIENFFTELIGYVLEHEEAACEDFLDAIWGTDRKTFAFAKSEPRL